MNLWVISILMWAVIVCPALAGAQTKCGTESCTSSQECLNKHCVAKGSTLCGGTVCTPSQQCMNNKCYAKGTKLCGSAVCTADQACLNASGPDFSKGSRGPECVAKGARFCGDTAVCDATQDCNKGRCYPKGSKPCGNSVCTANQECHQAVGPGYNRTECVAKGSTLCGSNSVCDATQECQWEKCYAKGHCGNSVCSASQECHYREQPARGPECVAKGSHFCGATAVCDASQNCVNHKCYAKGAILCGSEVCGGNQQCVGTKCVPKKSN